MKKSFYKNDLGYYIASGEVDENGYVEYCDGLADAKEIDCNECDLVELDILKQFHKFQIFCLDVEEEGEVFTLFKVGKYDDKWVFKKEA